RGPRSWPQIGAAATWLSELLREDSAPAAVDYGEHPDLQLRGFMEAVMANTREHRYTVLLTWTGNLGSGTSGYRDYSRDCEIGAEAKPFIHGSADATFRGDRSRWNPDELLLASLSACHKLWYRRRSWDHRDRLCQSCRGGAGGRARRR